MVIHKISNKVFELVRTGRSSGMFRTLSLDILAKGTTFAFIPLFTTVMSKEEFGLFTYLYVIITLASVVFKLGMDTAYQKLFFDLDESSRPTLIFTTNSIWLAFFSFVFLSALIFKWDLILLHLLIDKPIALNQIRLQFWLFILLDLSITTLSAFYLSRERFRKFQTFNFLKIVLSNVTAFILISNFDGNKVAFRLGLESVIGLIVFAPLLFELFSQARLSFNRNLARRAIKIGIPLFGGAVATSIFLFSDRYFLQKYFGMETLAVFNFCILYSLPISLVLTSFNTIWLPKIFKQKNAKVNMDATRMATKKLGLTFVLIAFVFWIGLFFLLNFKLLNSEYQLALWLFPIIAFAKIVETLTHLYINFLIIFEKTSFQFFLVICLSTLTLLLNFFFTPIYGIWAAVIIVLVVSSARFGITMYLARHLTNKEGNI